MALVANMMMTVDGSEVKGFSSQTTMAGEEMWVEALAYKAAVTLPREAESAKSLGRRQYTPIEVLKRVDAASPLLFKACTDQQQCEVVFHFFRPDGMGKVENFYEVKLQDARVASVTRENVSAIAAGTEGAVESAMLERIELTFQYIEETATADGGVSHVDDLKES